jgi:hypothetical protein
MFFLLAGPKNIHNVRGRDLPASYRQKSVLPAIGRAFKARIASRPKIVSNFCPSHVP